MPTRTLLVLDVLVGPVLVRLAGAVGVPRRSIVVVVLGAVALAGARIDITLGALRLLGATVAAAVHG